MIPHLSSRPHFSIRFVAVLAFVSIAFAQTPPLPDIPPPEPENSVPLGSFAQFEEVKLDFPIASGPFEATWTSIEKNYPGTPTWLRDAKFGIWVHFGPQSAGQSGDWYARNLYKPGHVAYQNHLRNYGHPSEFGYKEVLRDWNPTKLDPAALTLERFSPGQITVTLAQPTPTPTPRPTATPTPQPPAPTEPASAAVIH